MLASPVGAGLEPPHVERHNRREMKRRTSTSTAEGESDEGEKVIGLDQVLAGYGL